MFFCDIVPGEACGGLTAIVRNSEVFAKLDPKVVEKLAEKKIRYSRYLPSAGAAHAQYVSWQSSFYTEEPKVKIRYTYINWEFKGEPRSRNVLIIPCPSTILVLKE